MKSGTVRAAAALLLSLLLLPAGGLQAEEDGGSGGEVLDAEAAEESADAYYTELGLMLGRLMAGHELYRIGDRAEGGMHFRLLAEEHLPVVRDALEARDLDLLVRRIEQLATEAGNSDSWINVQDLHEASRMSLQNALTRVDPDKREDPAFKVRIVLALARDAVRYYERAVEDGEFVQPEMYQASWGFIRYGRLLLERNAALFGQSAEDARDSLVARYEFLMEAWPSVRLPAEPRLDPATLHERLAALESVAQERF